MVQVTIHENVWQNLVSVARRRNKRPETSAVEVLRDFIKRQADEELLFESYRAARRSKIPLAKTEELIRQHRKREKKA